MRTFEYVIERDTGLHARPAANITQVAEKYTSRIYIRCGDKTLNGKSLMGLLALSAACGETIAVLIEGEDEEAAEAGMRSVLEEQLGKSAG